MMMPQDIAVTTVDTVLLTLLRYLNELALPLSVPTVPEDGMSLAALRAVPQPSDDQLEALQMCHNAMAVPTALSPR
jgi:hypothetical protein